MALQGASGRQGFWIGAWCGLVTNFGGFWWVSEVLHDFGHLPSGVVWPITVLNAFYQGLSFAIFGLCSDCLRQPDPSDESNKGVKA